jgi:hypothetical protein
MEHQPTLSETLLDRIVEDPARLVGREERDFVHAVA